MDFTQVVEQLKTLNAQQARNNDELEDIKTLTEMMLERMAMVAEAISNQTKADTDRARQEMMNARKDRIRAGNSGGDDKKLNDERNDLLANLLGFGVALKAGIASIGLGILFAANRFHALTGEVDAAIQEVIDVMRGALAWASGFKTIGLRRLSALPFTIIKSIVDATYRFFRPLIEIMRGNYIVREGRHLSNAAKGFLAGIGGFIRMMVRIVGTVGNFVASLIPLRRVIGGLIGTIVRSVGRIFPFFNFVLIAFDAIKGALDAAQSGGDMIDIIRGAIEGVVTGFANIIRDIGGFFGWVAERIGILLGMNEEDAGRMRELITNFFGGVANVLETVGAIFGGVFEDISRFIGRFQEDPDAALRELLDNTVSMVGNALRSIGEYMWNSIRAIVSDIIRSTAALIPDWVPGGDAIRNRINSFADNISEEGVVELGQRRIQNVVDFGSAVADGSVLNSMRQQEAIEDIRRRAELAQLEAARTAVPAETISAPSPAASMAIAMPVVDASTRNVAVQQTDARRTIVGAKTGARDTASYNMWRG